MQTTKNRLRLRSLSGFSKKGEGWLSNEIQEKYISEKIKRLLIYVFSLDSKPMRSSELQAHNVLLLSNFCLSTFVAAF